MEADGVHELGRLGAAHAQVGRHDREVAGRLGRRVRDEGRHDERRCHREGETDGQQHPPPPQHGRGDREQQQADRDERGRGLQHDDGVCRRVDPAQRPHGDEAEQDDEDRDVGAADDVGLGSASTPQASTTTGMIIGRRRSLRADPAADHAAHDLLQLVVSRDPVGAASSSARSICGGSPASKTDVVLGEARARGSRGRRRPCRSAESTHDEDGDEALVAEDAPVLERASVISPTLEPST